MPMNKQASRKPRKPPRDRQAERNDGGLSLSATGITTSSATVHVQTNVSGMQCSCELEIQRMKAEIENITAISEKRRFCLFNIRNDDSRICFYTGFPTYAALKACFEFLGPAVNSLTYCSKQNESSTKRCRPRTLTPEEEFFLVLVRLRLGLMERDLADRFEISQSSVSRVITTWINFLYLKFKEIPLWPPKELILANMPKQFKHLYPSTRIIIDATEIFIHQPRVPEIQQMTFSNYKNHNTFKGLIGISPSGSVIFVSKLYPGSISDKELMKKSGLIELLECGDSVMADRGFDIEDELIVRGVQLNIPPFLRHKSQLDETEVISTRRIASLRIHVEREMERIKNFHIFDRIIPTTLTDIADRLFYVCCVLTNFHPHLC